MLPKTIHASSLEDLTGNLHPNSTSEMAQWLPPNRGAAILNDKVGAEFHFAHRYSALADAGDVNDYLDLVLARPMMLTAQSQLAQGRLAIARFYTGVYAPGAIPTAQGIVNITDETHIRVTKLASTAGECVLWYLPDDGAMLEILKVFDAGPNVSQKRELQISLRETNSVDPYNRGSKLTFASPSILVDGFHLSFRMSIPQYDSSAALGNNGAWVDLGKDAEPITKVSFDIAQLELPELAKAFGNPHLSLVQMRNMIVTSRR